MPGDPRRNEIPPPPTWDAFLRALLATRNQGFDLVQLSTACPGDGFEVVTAIVRRPEQRRSGA